MNKRRPGRWTRRELLAAGLAGSSLALAGKATRLIGQETPAPGSYGPFKMGIQSYSLRNFKFEEALEKTEKLGLHYWESYNAHVPTDASKADESRKAAAGHDVKVIGYGVVHFSSDERACRQLFEFGKELGIEYFSADPDPESFDHLDKLVEEFDIPVGIHNHGPGHRYDTIDRIASAIKGHHDKIGCCVDTGHFLRSRQDPVQAVETFGKRVYGVHLKDVKDATEFTVLGKGDLRTAELLKTLAENEYPYCLALEYEEHPEDPMSDIEACLAAVRKASATL